MLGSLVSLPNTLLSISCSPMGLLLQLLAAPSPMMVPSDYSANANAILYNSLAALCCCFVAEEGCECCADCCECCADCC